MNFKTFPCKDKRPLVTNWQELATDSESQYLTWYKQYPGCDWGVKTGDGLVVLDFDVKSGGMETYQGIKDSLPETFTVKTKNGGLHLYYQTNKAVRNKVGLLPGMDVRADGGYVIAAGSDGYKAQNSLEEEGIRPLPAFIESLLEEKPISTLSVGNVGEGGRNHYLAQVAGKLQKFGLLTPEGLEAINDRDCNPPLPGYEVTNIFESVSRYSVEVTLDTSTPYVKSSDLMAEFKDYISNPNKVIGEPTGIAGVDHMLGGGVRPGEVLGVLAPNKVGKSSFTHKIIHNWLEKGHKVGYASRELTPSSEVIPNLLSITLKTNVLTCKDLDYVRAGELLNKWELYFSKDFGHFPLEEMEEWLRALHALGVKHFLLDHMHHAVDDEDFKIIAKFARKLKSLVKELDIAFILVIQPTKLGPDQKVNFNAIRGGAAVGQAIDALLTLEREKDPETGRQLDVTKVTLDIARHKLAKPGTIYLQYDRETMDFIEVEIQKDGQDDEGRKIMLDRPIIMSKNIN